MSKTTTSPEIISEPNKHIIGQHKTKKAVATALHNRWRRQQVGDPLYQEITPKSVLMIGPAGVGKTKIVCRLTKLANAPFVKIKVTKLIEVGYVDRSVDIIVRDLVEMAVKQTRESEMKKVRAKAEDAAEDRILDVLIPPLCDTDFVQLKEKGSATCQTFCKKLCKGQLNDKKIGLEVSVGAPSMNIMGPLGTEDMTEQIRSTFAGLDQGKKNHRKVKVNGAFELSIDEETVKLVDEDGLKQKAMADVEQNGIVFLDEINKIASRSEYGGGKMLHQGVQRGLLPLVEGTTVNTKYGMIGTGRILFIALDTFHLSKSNDLIPELQGRFPTRVELNSLSAEDFRVILTQTDAGLTKQYQTLLKTEGADLMFVGDDIRCLAGIAYSVDEKIENIGARRLHTVIERLLEDLSLHVCKSSDETVAIDTAYVGERLSELSDSEDPSHCVL